MTPDAQDSLVKGRKQEGDAPYSAEEKKRKEKGDERR
jgi:hypothetical protein